MKKMRILTSALLVSLLTGCNIFNPANSNKIKSIEIIKNETSVEELEALVGDKFQLTVLANDNSNPAVKWESSNEQVAQVDNKGNVTILGTGEVIISVSVEGKTYINDSLYLKARNKVEQLGVGSGLSPLDPIFLGNEGDEEPIEIRFIEMQQIYADSIFIKKGNVEILIDTGYNYDGDFVKDVVEKYCPDNRLDMLMLSHSDGDHIDGLPKAITAVDNVSLMIDYGGTGSGSVLATRNKVKEDGGVYHSAYDCVNGIGGAVDTYYLTEDFYFEILNTGAYIKSDKASAGNGASVAVIFYYKDFSFFTAGDLTNTSEASLLKNEVLPEVTLYKAAHHGSHGSNSQELLDTLNPLGVAISAAIAGKYGATPGKPNKNNTYNLDGVSGHPAAEAIGRIYKAPNISQNLNVYWNGVNGTMKFTSYGTNDFTFEGSPTLKGYYDLSKTNGVAVWNEELQNFENRITGEENFKLHETKIFEFRGYDKYLPAWAKQ